MGLSYDCDVLDLVYVYVISVAAQGFTRIVVSLAVVHSSGLRLTG